MKYICFCLQSTEVLQFVKRDLDEFSSAVKSEASNVVSSTTSALKDKLRVSCISLFFTWSAQKLKGVIVSFSSFYSLLYCCALVTKYNICPLLETVFIIFIFYLFICLFLAFTATWTRISSKHYEEKCIIILWTGQHCAESHSRWWGWRGNCHPWLPTCSAHKVPGYAYSVMYFVSYL